MEQENAKLNGLDTVQMTETIGALQAQPTLAKLGVSASDTNPPGLPKPVVWHPTQFGSCCSFAESTSMALACGVRSQLRYSRRWHLRQPSRDPEYSGC